MAAPERPNDWWLVLQQRREERMRFEVLSMLFEAANRCADFPVETSSFLKRLGVWESELNGVLEYLDSQGYVHYRHSDLEAEVCLTLKGVDYLGRDAGRRRTIRN